MEQTIKSVRLTAKNRLKYVVAGEHQYGDETVYDEVSHYPKFIEPSQSLLNAFKLLLPHYLVHIKSTVVKIDADYIKQKKALKDNKLKDFAVTGFVLSGEGDDEKVVLEGKIIQDDKGMPLKTLKIPLYGNEEYPFSGNLVEDLESLKEEVESFREGNFNTSAQPEIEFPESDDEEETEELF